MTRKQIIEFCNKEVFPEVQHPMAQFMDMIEVIGMVTNWRRANGYPKTMHATVEDGFLWINENQVGRIAPKAPKLPYSETAAYWEGRILARQERYVEG